MFDWCFDKYIQREKIFRSLENEDYLKLNNLKDIYRDKYWKKFNFAENDNILNRDVCYEIFEMAIHFGAAASIMILQKSLDEIKEEDDDWISPDIDGIAGLKTLRAFKACCNHVITKSTINGHGYEKLDVVTGRYMVGRLLTTLKIKHYHHMANLKVRGKISNPYYKIWFDNNLFNN